jgi:hypothetical protein
MLRIEFEGYFQLRMATDPDPTDERRGVSGYTFALAGEPDLDAVLHFQPDEDGVCERPFGPSSPGPRVGVRVRRATRRGESAPELDGARVAFVGARVLEDNGILVRNDFFVIDPLRVRVWTGDRVFADRTDWLNPTDLANPRSGLTSAMLLRRQPKRFVTNSPEVAVATGLPDPSNATLIDNRKRRRRSLEALRAGTTDPTKRAALDTRIEQLEVTERWWELSQGDWSTRPIDRRAYALALQLEGWDIDMSGPVDANDVGGDAQRPWPLRFWLGGWDADALCGYVRGTWDIPLA